MGGLPAHGCTGRSRAVSATLTPAKALEALLPPGCGFEALDATSFRIVARPMVAEAAPPKHSEAAPPGDAPKLDELVVTAEKRPELLAHSATAISVLSADDLDALGGKSFDAIVGQVVSVAVTNLGSGRDKLFVRGLSDGSFTGKTQSTVGLYLDDTPITYNAPDPDLRLADVDRVEVLRGPQGTLYGSGSMGGIVRIVTAKPDVSAAYGDVAVDGALTQRGGPSDGFEAMANLPLADGKAAVRAVLYNDESGGYIDNPVLGLKNVNYTRRTGGRIAALADLPDGWTVESGFVQQKIAASDSQYTQGGDGPLSRDAAVREPYADDFSELTVTASHQGGIADLKVSSAYIDHALETRYDATGAFRAAGGSTTGGAFDEDSHIRLFTTEGLLSSNMPGRWRWLAGGFLSYTDEVDQAFLVDVNPVGPTRSIYRRRDSLAEGALYGEVAYDISSRLTATLGARWFVTRVDTRADDFDIAEAPIPALREGLTDQGVAPKFRVSYAAAAELVIYGQVQEGYRAGGFNIPAAAGGPTTEAVSPQFKPDHLWSYEIGATLPVFDHRLMLRGAVFHADWDGLQTDQRLASGLPLTVNIGDGSNTGVEGEAVWRPDDHLLVRINMLIEDPKITRAGDVFPARRDIGLPGVPYDMGGADLRYRWRIGPYQAEASAQAVYVGRSYLTFDGGVDNAMGGYASGRLAGTLRAQAWRATLYLDNVADERGNTFAFGNPFSRARATQATPLRPRTLGFGVAHSF
ncbi:TonB-dependent receptor [Phenylobacterium sp.]|uniref:TonB-dependent receptor n=1 Tax=Phenylobacterium sp. TaxID=1871053 RepID=UPI0025E4007B|nr:TonB-dependent receptor [Phenylobacterium sp.]